ncbi:MAG: hypothetical protein V4510_08795 [bacterium]
MLAGLGIVAILATGLVAAVAAHGFGGAPGGPFAAAANDATRCPPGELSESSGAVNGDCIAFNVDAATGMVSAFTLTVNGTSTRLVDSIAIPALAGGSETVRRDYALATDDVRFMARDGPGLLLASRNGTAATITFPADALVVIHDAVADWSPAGATVTIGAIKLNLVLPPGSSMSANGNTLSLQLGPGIASLEPAGAPPVPPLGEGRDGMHERGQMGEGVGRPGHHGPR